MQIISNGALDAFMKKEPYFEGCLPAVCAKSNKSDGIITRNKKDFSNFGIPLFSPREIIDLL